MKSRLYFLILSALLTALLALRFSNAPPDDATFDNQPINISRIGCAPDWSSLRQWLDESNIPLVPGSGTHHWKISTASDSAQRYFDQGMNMYYSFHIIEAMASFKKAARFDSTCAILHWAQALAYGPNINDSRVATEEALASEAKAIELSSNANEMEKALIDAMNVRYSKDSTAERKKLDSQYTAKMKEAYAKYAIDPDVSALYADAMMLEHPWDLWTVDGKPKPWTPAIRETLENLLLIDSAHPGANHYYIHVMEPSPYADKAMPSARRLGNLTPALSHTVHMPSHIYLRTGDYPAGVDANKKAIKSYHKMSALYSPATANDFLYLIHNIHMQTNLAMMGGELVEAVESASATAASVSPEYLGMQGSFGNSFQYIWMTPVLVDVRFERWKELIERTPPDDSLTYARIIYFFGRGMAHAGLDSLAAARTDLEKLHTLMRDSTLYVPFNPFSAAIEGAKTAEQMLTGAIYQREKKYEEAIKAFSMAVNIERNMVYSEPRDWMLNPRPYLGNVLTLAGQADEAEKVFSDDFVVNNNNFWSAQGLKKIRR